MCECIGCQACTLFSVEWDFEKKGEIAGKQCYQETLSNKKNQRLHLTNDKRVCQYCLRFAVTRAEENAKKAKNSWAPSKSSAVNFAGASEHLPTASAWATTTSAWATTTGSEELTKEDGLRMTKCLQDMNENIKNVEKNLQQRQEKESETAQQRQEKETETATKVKEIHCMLANLTKRLETLERQLTFVLPSAPPGLPSPPRLPSASDGG